MSERLPHEKDFMLAGINYIVMRELYHGGLTDKGRTEAHGRRW